MFHKNIIEIYMLCHFGLEKSEYFFNMTPHGILCFPIVFRISVANRKVCKIDFMLILENNIHEITRNFRNLVSVLLIFTYTQLSTSMSDIFQIIKIFKLKAFQKVNNIIIHTSRICNNILAFHLIN